MKENPYSKMLEIMRKGSSQFPPSIQFGEVVQAPPNLVIRLGDLQIDKANILIADYLLPKYQRKVTIRGERLKFRKDSPVGETEVNSAHSHSLKYVEVDNVSVEIDAKGESSSIQWEDTLKPGDKLAILPTADRQTYIILARVVNL